MSAPGQTKGTVFVDDSVDTRAPAPSPDKPVSSSDIIGATWTLSRQDFVGAPLQAEEEAYAPLYTALEQRAAPRGILGGGSPYVYPSARGVIARFNRDAIWQDVARYRATDPNFLHDVPAKNADEFAAWVKAQELKRRRQAQDVVGREQGFGQKALGFGTGVVSSLADPINLGAMALTGPIGGGAKSLLSVVARDAVINMAIETAELPAIASNRAAFGEDMSGLDMLEDVGMAGVAGAAFPVAGRVGKAVAKPVIDIAGDTLAPAVRATQRTLAPWALGRANIEQASDAEIARSFADSVPFAARTPEAQAGLYVLDRETEVQGASPYLNTPGGLDANAQKLTATATAIGQPATVGRGTVDVSRGTRPRDTTPLTQDTIVNFVLNDLEGGGKLVNLGDGGGLTKYGVTERGNPDVDVANLSQTDAARIARQRYWLPEFNRADPRVAAIAFDASYIANPKLARRIIAEAGDDVDKAMSIYREHLNQLADTNPEKARFKKGWNNRLDKLARFVGDAEAGRVRLHPEGFGGDDVAYRVAQDQLNAEELRLADDTPARADPVRDFVDRIGAGEDLSAPDMTAFRASNAEAIDAELARRVDLGSDGHPDPLGAPAASAPKLDINALADRVADLIAADHSTNPARIARTLGTDADTAQRALSIVAGRPDSGLRVATKTGRVSRVPVFRGPKDVLRTIVEAGGIRDDEGHILRKGGRDLGQFFIPGLGKLISMKHGQSIDRIGEMLHESGFFLDRPSTAEVLDMIDRATFGEKFYSLHDSAAIADRGDAEVARANEHLLDQAHDALIDRVPQDAIDDSLTHDVAYLIAQGTESGEAVSLAIEWRERSVLDMIHDQVEDPDYDFRTAQTDAFGAETGDPGRFGEGDVGREAFAGIEDGSPAGDEPARWAALERSDGAASDAAEEAGLNGPPPLDPKVGGIDDAIGPEAALVADSLEHDVKATLDLGEQLDPEIADKQRQQAKLKAASPLQAKADQEGTIGLELFDKADQPDFMIELDGVERPMREVINELDRDAAAIKAARDCQ